MDLIGSRIGVDMGLFTKLDESAEPLSTNDIAASLGGDPVMVGKYFPESLCIPVFSY